MRTISKIRLSVPLSKDIYDKVQGEAIKLGISMSSYVAFVVGSYYQSGQDVKEQFKSMLTPELLSNLLEKGYKIDNEQKEIIEAKE